ncbi:MAG: hypothetical protein LBF72_03440 [Holosporales bacterium]|jgi:undecaprenyl-diphosphatase|nr:hypothetical protein [Holosporales bacterium]
MELHIIPLLVQSITECLPVSSSAHILVLEAFSPLCLSNCLQEALFHLIPLCSFVVVFWSEFWQLLLGCLRIVKCCWSPNHNDTQTLIVVRNIILANVPLFIAGVVLHFFPYTITHKKLITSLNLIIFGFLLRFADMWWNCGHEALGKSPGISAGKTMRELTPLNASIIGLAQVLAFFPGVSRMGICITMARFFKLGRVDALRLACLTGMPVLVYEAGKNLLNAFCGAECTEKVAYIESCVVSGHDVVNYLFVALLMILSCGTLKLLKTYVSRYSFSAIAVFRILLGGILFILALIK